MGSRSVAASTPLDALAFSSGVAGAVAAGLVLASGLAIAPGLGWSRFGSVMGLAGAGTLVVYNVDRLRDLERDARTAPLRTAFIRRNRGLILAMTGAAAAACLPLAWLQPPRTWALCGGVLGLGLLHRRLKGHAGWKVAYVTLAWLSIVVGLPASSLAGRSLDPATTTWVVVVVGLAVAANLIASDLRDAGEQSGGRGALLGAQSLCAAGVMLAGLAGGSVWPLLAIPLCEGVALMRFRPNERYGLLVIDGALLGGALLAAITISGLT